MCWEVEVARESSMGERETYVHNMKYFKQEIILKIKYWNNNTEINGKKLILVSFHDASDVDWWCPTRLPPMLWADCGSFLASESGLFLRYLSSHIVTETLFHSCQILLIEKKNVNIAAVHSLLWAIQENRRVNIHFLPYDRVTYDMMKLLTTTKQKDVPGTVLGVLGALSPSVPTVALWSKSYCEPHFKEKKEDLGK